MDKARKNSAAKNPSVLTRFWLLSLAGLSLSALLSSLFLIALTQLPIVVGLWFQESAIKLVDSVPGLFTLFVALVCVVEIFRSHSRSESDDVRVPILIATVPLAAAFSVLFLKWVIPNLTLTVF